MISKTLPTLAVSLLGLAAAPGAISFPFNSTLGTYQPAAFVGWTTAHRSGATVTNLTNTTPDGNTAGANQIGIGNAAGVGGTASYLFSINDGTGQVFAASTTFSSETATSVTWQIGNNNASTLVQLLVQSGGNWYATQASYSSPSTTLPQFQSGGSTLLAVDLATATWNSYNLTTMTTGAASVLPSTTLTGVGFQITNPTDNSVTRIDNVNVIPEPSALLLGAAGLLGFCGKRRR